MKMFSQMDAMNERVYQYQYDEKGELVLDDEGRPCLHRRPIRETPEQEKYRALGLEPPEDPDDEQSEADREAQNAANLAALHSPDAAEEQAKYPPNTEPEPDAVDDPDSAAP